MKPEDLNPLRKVLGSIHQDARQKAQKIFGPFKYSLKGKRFTCSHCGNDLFHRSKGQANTRFATIMGLDWLDPQMAVLICSECGLVFWMSNKPQKVD
jgi:transcription elongation factor Elf1